MSERKVFGYIRTNGPQSRLTEAQQIQEITEYAHKHNYVIERFYIDLNCSAGRQFTMEQNCGKQGPVRPQLDKLLRDTLGYHTYTPIIVTTSLQILTRSRADYAFICDILRIGDRKTIRRADLVFLNIPEYDGNQPELQDFMTATLLACHEYQDVDELSQLADANAELTEAKAEIALLQARIQELESKLNPI
jgi:DNA invertase Pin-like site-specific DNA recombinase